MYRYEDFISEITGGLFPEMAMDCEEFLRKEFNLGDWEIKKK